MLHPYAYPFARWPTPQVSGSKTVEPSYYYTCDKEKGVLEVELPGVAKDDIKVEIHGHHLSVSAKRMKKGDVVCNYTLDLRLGHDADINAVKGVSCNDGMLVVHVPTLKKEEGARQIAIE